MTPLHICLLIVGVILMVGSFFVAEKLTDKEVDELSRLSSAQLQRVVDKELESVEDRVADIVSEAVDKTVEETKRPMEQLSNEKIMAINEYSDTVIDQINKSHSEIIFLYNMLNDKQEEIKTIVAGIDRDKARLKEMTAEVDLLENKMTLTPSIGDAVESIDVTEGTIEEKEEPDERLGFIFSDSEKKKEDKGKLHDEIIALYDEGLPIVEIGRRLKCGVGEVKLVIDLANHGGSNEA
ncbi:MAG: hypothetical protein E7241_04195 [Lachnospiraceae bacterium]|nr:hypothetical protein [Lachnospiraceae bacterium]